MSESVYTLHRGTTPLLISVPHVGTEIPADLAPRYTERALAVEDTDWYLDRLYAFAVDLGAGLIVPRYSRYVIDLNRPRENTPMYAGQNNTELCPTRHFTGEPIYRPGQAPDAAEIERRVGVYWQPYRAAIDAELERIRAAHGHAVFFDGHSIRSELPWLFEGRLPQLNLGTVGATSCGRGLRLALTTLLAAQQRYTHVVDGRFRGGDLTRTHGRPAEGLHAVQLEMCWRAYFDEAAPPRWDEARAAEVKPLLRAMVRTMIAWRP
ncbi:MAG: N-formylglutamate deformylase [Burkholderiales bacterium]|nr:N-formylglutamate deformylase [Burkholderiales bacterium]